MSDKAGYNLGLGMAFFGFWLMIGLANFGEDRYTIISKVQTEVLNKDCKKERGKL